MIFELIGIVGSFLMSVCTIPQTAKCIWQGHARGISLVSLLITLIGSCCILTYMIHSNVGFIIMINIIVLIVTMLIQIKYIIWPRNKELKDGNK
jgi:uncharacterized protein with PQ loop repeat